MRVYEIDILGSDLRAEGEFEVSCAAAVQRHVGFLHSSAFSTLLQGTPISRHETLQVSREIYNIPFMYSVLRLRKFSYG